MLPQPIFGSERKSLNSLFQNRIPILPINVGPDARTTRGWQPPPVVHPSLAESDNGLLNLVDNRPLVRPGRREAQAANMSFARSN